MIFAQTKSKKYKEFTLEKGKRSKLLTERERESGEDGTTFEEQIANFKEGERVVRRAQLLSKLHNVTLRNVKVSNTNFFFFFLTKCQRISILSEILRCVNSKRKRE